MSQSAPASSPAGARPTDPAARPGPLGRLGRAAFRHRGRTVLAWVATLFLAIGLSTAFGGDFFADYSAPGSDSSKAQTLLEDRFAAQSGDTVDVVVRADKGAPAVRSDVNDLLAKLAAVPHVAAVENPYTSPGGIAPDGKTLVSHVRLDVVNPLDMPVADTTRMLDIAKAAEAPDLQVALGGQSISQAESGDIGSEGIGIAAAA